MHLRILDTAVLHTECPVIKSDNVNLSDIEVPLYEHEEEFDDVEVVLQSKIFTFDLFYAIFTVENDRGVFTRKDIVDSLTLAWKVKLTGERLEQFIKVHDFKEDDWPESLSLEEGFPDSIYQGLAYKDGIFYAENMKD
jgi:hypothetical protein